MHLHAPKGKYIYYAAFCTIENHDFLTESSFLRIIQQRYANHIAIEREYAHQK